tara:strand:+ start:101243 stop:102052 length:810 start_codon:yes stop_codon:yes gene_type:complete
MYSKHDSHAQRALDLELKSFMKACHAESKQHNTLTDLIHAVQGKSTIYLAEPWMNQDERSIAHEVLFRFRHESNQILRYDHIANDLISADLAKGFDLVNFFNILSWLPCDENAQPFSINLTHDSLITPEICEKIIEANNRRDGPQLIIEILEDERLFTSNELQMLQKMKQSGIAFALDDFRVSIDSDWERLKSLEHIVSYVKLDGKDSVRPFLDNGGANITALFNHIADIQDLVGSDKKVIAEWVQTPQEAHKLFDGGVHAVQGHKLAF